MGTKLKCLKCNDIIEGDRRGTLISCSCNACFIDETPYYYRIGGDGNYIAMIDENGNETKLTEMASNSPKKEEPEIKATTCRTVYIFLDIDGVMNNEEYIKECYERNGHHAMHMSHAPFDPKCLNNLMILCRQIEANDFRPLIILSSTWRLHEIPTEIVDARLAEYGLSIFDKTDNINGERGKEILRYMNEHKSYIDYLVLDDEDYDMLAYLEESNIIHTDYRTGFDNAKLEEALNYLKEKGIVKKGEE